MLTDTHHLDVHEFRLRLDRLNAKEAVFRWQGEGQSLVNVIPRALWDTFPVVERTVRLSLPRLS